ncbi:MAG: hypothetical protein V1731_02210 [Candidatus Aenigmatarchaeota archaeon]
MDNLSSYCSARAYRSKSHPSSTDKAQKADYSAASSLSSAVLCACSYNGGGGRRKKQDEFGEELL